MEVRRVRTVVLGNLMRVMQRRLVHRVVRVPTKVRRNKTLAARVLQGGLVRMLRRYLACHVPLETTPHPLGPPHVCHVRLVSIRPPPQTGRYLKVTNDV